MKELEFQDYLGDGVYVGWDGYHIIITANDKATGMPTDRIGFDPHVIMAFLRYSDRLKEYIMKGGEHEGTNNQGADNLAD